MNFHLCRFRGFLLYYNRKCRELLTTLGNDDVLDIAESELFNYCGSPDFHDDLETGLSRVEKVSATAVRVSSVINCIHQTVAVRAIQPEPEVFDVHEYADYNDVIDDIVDALSPDRLQDIYQVHNIMTKPSNMDYNLLCPFVVWAPAETIKRTLCSTTQYARGRVSDTLRQHWKSRFPACNVRRCNEAVATDTIFSNTPAVDSGVKAAQLFIGRKSLVANVYPVKTDKEFVNDLEDNIQERELWISSSVILLVQRPALASRTF
jgi:hypothetical protein